MLVEVHAASINPIDWKIRAAYLKEMVPLTFPTTLGGNFAQKYGVIALGQNTQTNTKNLTRLRELVDGGKIKVHIDKVYPLENVKEAFGYQEEDHP